MNDPAKIQMTRTYREQNRLRYIKHPITVLSVLTKKVQCNILEPDEKELVGVLHKSQKIKLYENVKVYQIVLKLIIKDLFQEL